MILENLYNECKKIKKNDELVLSFTDARKIKAELEKFLLAPVKPRPVVYKKKKAIKKIKPVKQAPEVKDAFDEWMEIQPRGYTPGIDAAPVLHLRDKKRKQRSRPGGFKQIGKKDKMVTAKSDMINHIQDMIDRQEISINEYLADPEIYLDSQIMGNYIHSPILTKSIVKHFQRKVAL
jgi:hypothetical protein